MKNFLLKHQGKLTLLAFVVMVIISSFGNVVDKNEGEMWLGCALDSCPQSWQDWHYRNGGQKYYAEYERDSKEFLNAYCNSMLDTPYECK